VGSAEGVCIEIAISIEAYAGQDAVVEGLFQYVCVLCITGEQQHTPVPEHVADVGAGFVVGRGIGKLVVAAISLMYFLDIGGIVGCGIGGDAVVERSAAACDIHFPFCHVGPDSIQIMAKGIVSGLCYYVGHAGIEIIGSYCMTHCGVLIAEGDPVLVIVGAVADQAADVDEVLCQLEVGWIFCGPVELDDAHIMGRADSVAGQFGGAVMIESYEVIGCFYSDVEKVRFTCCAKVNTGCGHEVAHVVGLEIETVFEGGGLAGMFVFFDHHGSMDVAVGALAFCYDGYGMIHEAIQLFVFGDGVNCGHSFQ